MQAAFTTLALSLILIAAACVIWELDQIRAQPQTVYQTQCMASSGTIRCVTWPAGDQAAMARAGAIMHGR